MRKRLYITKKGILKREENTLCFVDESGKKRFIPVSDVAEIHVFGEVRFNKRMLEFLTMKGITLHVYSHHGYYMGSYYPRMHYNSCFMTLRQAQHYLDPKLRVDLAARIVKGSIGNMMRTLKYYESRIGGLQEYISDLEMFLSKADEQRDIEALMGIEGNARRKYYQSFPIIIRREGFELDRRERRPPRNMINALISFGNSLMYATVLGEIYKTHLDPRIGFLHTVNSRKFSLVMDIADIFKPIIPDRVIFKLLNKQMIDLGDFRQEGSGVFLNDRGKRKFLSEYESRIASTIVLGRRKLSYAGVIRVDLLKLERHLIGELEYVPFVSRW